MNPLKEFLENSATEYKVILLLEIIEHLNTLGLHSFLNDIDLVLTATDQNLKDIDSPMISVEKDTAETLMEIEFILKNALISALKRYNVEIENESDLTTIFEISKTLMVIPNYGDIEILLTTLNQEINPILKISEVVNVIENTNEGMVANTLYSVDESLIDKMVIVLENQMEYNENPKREKNIERFRLFVEKNDPIIYKKLFKQGLKIGLNLETLLDHCLVEMDDILDNYELFVNELLAIILMSNTNKDEIKKVAADIVEDFYDNLDTISKINSIIIKKEV